MSRAKLTAARLAAFAVIIGLTLATAQAAFAELHPNERQGWLVGFGFGGGSLGLTSKGASSERTGGTAGFFRVGYAFNPDLSLELNSSAWTKEENGTTMTFSSGTVALDYYPGRTGLVLRAGVGAGSGKAARTKGTTTESVEETGFGLLVGAAYEFRVMRTFALGPQVEFGLASLDSFDANWVNFGLGFNWYFIPRKP